MPLNPGIAYPPLAHTLALAVMVLLLGACAAQPRPADTVPAPAAAPVTTRSAATPATTASLESAAMPATAGSVQPAADARAHLADAIDAFIAQPRFRHARWGIEVRDLDTGRTLYAHQAHKLFIPASNAKLYIAALALDTLGPDHRFHTSLYATRHPNARGVMKGDLVLAGRGDPGLGMALQGDKAVPDPAWADQLAAALVQRGIRRVTGDLIADDTWYAGPPYGAGWEIDDALGGYAPPVSALSVQDNAFSLRIGGNGSCCNVEVDPADVGVDVVDRLRRGVDGSYDPLGLYRPPGSDRLYVIGSRPPSRWPRTFTLAAPDPARLAGALLLDALKRRGIRLDGNIRVRHWPEQPAAGAQRHMLRITDVRSAPLQLLVRHMLKESDNLYAQLLLLAVGKRQQAAGTCDDQPHPPTLTAGWGLCAMRAWLQGIGIAPGATQFEEGSGLSRKDRVTPDATVSLLEWVARQPFADAFGAALPVAGVDGTLENRLRDGPAAGNLRAKTGTLHLAYTLSGYVHAANGDRLAFSIMLNGYAAPTTPGGSPAGDPPTREIDAIARLVTGYGQVPLAAPVAAPARPAPAPASSSRTPGASAG